MSTLDVASPQSTKLTILAVDDDKPSSISVPRYLSKQGFQSCLRQTARRP